MIDRAHPLPLTRQSEILELSRSSLYYEPMPISAQDLELMRLIDEIHLKFPIWEQEVFGTSWPIWGTKPAAGMSAR